MYYFNMAQWLSWLERRPVTAEVESSSLFWVVVWGLSSAGRASALQAEGHRFEPYRSHIMDGFPSGQRGQTVNLLATPSKVRILLHPFRCEIHLLPVLTGQPMARRCGSIGRAADL